MWQLCNHWIHWIRCIIASADLPPATRHFRTWIPLASRGARPEHVQSSRSKVISGQFCGPCGYPNKLFPVWGSSGPLLGPCWAFLRHFVGPLERARGSVWPSWDFLCVTREAFPHSRHAAVDGHPRCRNQHWRSHGKRDFPDTRKHLEGSPKGPRGGFGPLGDPNLVPKWVPGGVPEGFWRGLRAKLVRSPL